MITEEEREIIRSLSTRYPMSYWEIFAVYESCKMTHEDIIVEEVIQDALKFGITLHESYCINGQIKLLGLG